MRIAGIRDLRARGAELLGGAEPVVVTKHGRVAGVYLSKASSLTRKFYYLQQLERLPYVSSRNST